MTEAEQNLADAEAAIADLPAEKAHRILALAAWMKSPGVAFETLEPVTGEELKAAHWLHRLQKAAQQ